MAGEQNKILEGIEFAIQMEVDGKKYYLEASRQCGNKLGKELFAAMSEAEDRHREKFTRIYQTLKLKKGWPDVKVEASSDSKLKTIFSTLARVTTCQSDEAKGQLDAIETAMQKEEESRQLYKTMSDKARYESEKAFYDSIMLEEKSHYLALMDYREFILDPEGYFVAQGHALDGG